MIFFPTSDRPCRSRGRQIGGERPTVEQARGLEGARDASLNGAVGGKPVQPTTVQSDDAAIGPIGAAQQPKKGRLAGAVGADHAIDLALVDGKIDGVDGADAAERLAGAFDLEKPAHRRADFIATQRTSASSALMKPPGIRMITRTKIRPAISRPMPEDRFNRSGIPTMKALPSRGPSTRPAPPTLNATNITKPT